MNSLQLFGQVPNYWHAATGALGQFIQNPTTQIAVGILRRASIGVYGGVQLTHAIDKFQAKNGDTITEKVEMLGLKIIHSTAFIASGILAVVPPLHEIAHGTAHTLTVPMLEASHVLFGLGNGLVLIDFLREYHTAMELRKSPETAEEGRHKEINAILGIGSSVFYMAASAAALFGPAAGLSVLFLILGGLGTAARLFWLFMQSDIYKNAREKFIEHWNIIFTTGESTSHVN